jgi:hypothetical protein
MFSKQGQIVVLIFVFIGMVVVILAAAWFIGRARSGGPPESVTLGQFKSSDPSNLSEARVISKSRCSSISTNAQAQGVKEAWLVQIGYKNPNPNGPTKVVDAYALIDGKWLFLINRRCP